MPCVPVLTETKHFGHDSVILDGLHYIELRFLHQFVLTLEESLHERLHATARLADHHPLHLARVDVDVLDALLLHVLGHLYLLAHGRYAAHSLASHAHST